MNLFFRFLRIMLAAMFTWRRTSLMDLHTIRSKVWLGDQDPMGHMTNSRYSSFTDLAIMNYMGRTGALRAFRKRGWLPVIQYESFFYHRMLRYPQPFEVQTRLAGWGDTHLVFRHEFISGERIHATSLMIARLTGRKKTRVTAAMAMEAMGLTLESPPLDPQVLDILRELKAPA
ncbi:thioesterase family protein [Hyphomonas sp.]|uniref:thioesterase family protein n=1 Tax=Hyphomonas sp. TaxID=87 RepID=UPI00391DD953